MGFVEVRVANREGGREHRAPPEGIFVLRLRIPDFTLWGCGWRGAELRVLQLLGMATSDQSVVGLRTMTVARTGPLDRPREGPGRIAGKLT